GNINNPISLAEEVGQNTLMVEDRKRHFEAVWLLAREWSKQIYYFESEDDFSTRKLFPTKFKSSDAQLGHHRSGPLQWNIQNNGSIEITFDVERDLLFSALRQHLINEVLWQDFEELKSWLAKGIEQAGEKNTIVTVANKVSPVRGRIMQELETLLAKHKNWFPGRCRFCPD
ncbi:hypothetical protein ACFLUG_05285, partial [Chloroflexota bacterium]